LAVGVCIIERKGVGYTTCVFQVISREHITLQEDLVQNPITRLIVRRREAGDVVGRERRATDLFLRGIQAAGVFNEPRIIISGHAELFPCLPFRGPWELRPCQAGSMSMEIRKRINVFCILFMLAYGFG
jgi:hypothetical protein